jgi:hypothetical protein
MRVAAGGHPPRPPRASAVDTSWVPKTRVTWADALQSAVPRPVPGRRSWPVWTCDDLRLVGLKLIFLTVSSAMSLLRLSRREDCWKDAEILMLRHQLAVAQRQRPQVHARLTWLDRAWLALLAGTLPTERLAGMRLIVTPGMILRWHRDIVGRRWRDCRAGAAPDARRCAVRSGRASAPPGRPGLGRVPVIAGAWDPGAGFLRRRPAQRHDGLRPGRDRARHPPHSDPGRHAASSPVLGSAAGQDLLMGLGDAGWA